MVLSHVPRLSASGVRGKRQWVMADKQAAGRDDGGVRIRERVFKESQSQEEPVRRELRNQGSIRL